MDDSGGPSRVEVRATASASLGGSSRRRCLRGGGRTEESARPKVPCRRKRGGQQQSGCNASEERENLRCSRCACWSGSGEALLPPRPPGTVHDTFASYGSRLHERPSRDATHSVSFSSAHGSVDGSCR